MLPALKVEISMFKKPGEAMEDSRSTKKGNLHQLLMVIN